MFSAVTAGECVVTRLSPGACCAGRPSSRLPGGEYRRGRVTLWSVDGSRGHDRVRRSYDAVARQYTDACSGELAGKPLDRALLACLTEQAGPGARSRMSAVGPGTSRAGSPATGGLPSELTCPRAWSRQPGGPTRVPSSGRGISLTCRPAMASSGPSSRSTRSSTWRLKSLTRLSGRSAACYGPAGACSLPSTSVPRSGSWNSGGVGP